jgi:hypothetical protein
LRAVVQSIAKKKKKVEEKLKDAKKIKPAKETNAKEKNAERLKDNFEYI